MWSSAAHAVLCLDSLLIEHHNSDEYVPAAASYEDATRACPGIRTNI